MKKKDWKLSTSYNDTQARSQSLNLLKTSDSATRKESLTTRTRKLRTTLNGQIEDGSHCRIKCPLKDSYKNTIEVQSQGTYFLLRFSNRKKKGAFVTNSAQKPAP